MNNKLDLPSVEQKFEVVFYNRFACQTQTFYVFAKDEQDAERLFWLMHNKERYMGDCIEYIGRYYEPHFYTEEEINIKRVLR